MMKDGFSIYMNVCPSIVFSTDGTGYVRSPSGAIEGFTWKMKSEKLSVVHAGDIQDRMLEDSIYSVSITYDKGQYNAILEAEINHEKFYLGK